MRTLHRYQNLSEWDDRSCDPLDTDGHWKAAIRYQCQVYRTNSGALSRNTETGRAIQGLRRLAGLMTWVSVEVHSLGYVCCDERALAGLKIGVEMRRSYDRHHAGM